MPMVQGRSPWSFLSSPSASPLERASAVGDLGGGDVDLSSAFSMGSSAAGGGMDTGGMDDSSDDVGLSSISPMLVKMAQAQMGAMGGDDTPTSEDKGLALAQAGFGIAAGESPHALTNIGAGAVGGIQALQRMRQQRAVQRMRESQLAQQTALRQATLMDAAKQKQAALDAARTTADEKAAIEREKIAAKKETDAARAAEAGDRQQAAADRAQALADTRYTQSDLRRRENYQKSGQWTKIAGDEERGITGAPVEDQPYNGPQITDPTIPLKDRNKFKIEQPKQTQAMEALDLQFNNINKNIDDLGKHPGLSGAVGLRIGQEMIPGSDAATFKAKLGSLKSQVFANAIQAMRDASKTGGAVGNVSDKEGARFEVMLGALDQSQDEASFKEALTNIKDYIGNLRSTYHQTYNARYGELPKKPQEQLPGGIDGPPAPAPSGNVAPVKITNEAEYNALEPGTAYIDPNGTRRTKR